VRWLDWKLQRQWVVRRGSQCQVATGAEDVVVVEKPEVYVIYQYGNTSPKNGNTRDYILT
jgi:hypothetical protein